MRCELQTDRTELRLSNWPITAKHGGMYYLSHLQKKKNIFTGGSLGGEDDCGPGLVVEELEPLRHGAQLPLDALARHTPHLAARNLEINIYFVFYMYDIHMYTKKGKVTCCLSWQHRNKL